MKKGFTLIELIVVMAILAILVTLAAPKFLGQTEKANQTGVRVDVKVLEDAAMMAAMESIGGATLPTTGSALITADAVNALAVSPAVGDVTADEFTAMTAGSPAGEVFAIDESLVKPFIKTIKNGVDAYVIVKGGDNNGSVYKIDAVGAVRSI